MKYWTLFTLRVTVRLALTLAVLLWVVGSFSEREAYLNLKSVSIQVRTGDKTLAVEWWPPMLVTEPDPGIFVTRTFLPAGQSDSTFLQDIVDVEPHLDLLGVKSWTDTLSWGTLRIDHWFLCLTFLIAAVATSVMWRQRHEADDKEMRVNG